jgi:hypothetical protein
MSRPLKPLEKAPTRPGGTTPIAKILLPQFVTEFPIRLAASAGDAARRIAESTRRRGRPI